MSSWKRKTVLFLSGQTLSLFGSSLVQYALMWHLTLETKSGAVMTGYILAGFLPSLVLSPLAGVWADRYDRKRLIAMADGFIALVSLAAAILLFNGALEIPLFFSVAALRSFGSAVHQPAVGAFLPRIVPKEELMRVNGIYGSVQSALMLVSPVAAGALLAVTDIPVIFLIDVVTAALAISALLFLVRPEEAPAGSAAEPGPAAESAETIEASEGLALEAPVNPFRDIADGIRYIRTHRYLLSFFTYMAFVFFLVAPAAFLTTIQTARSFGEEVWRLTALEIVFSVGMMAGGAAIASWGGFRNRMKTINLASVIMALCTLGLAGSPFLPVTAAFPAYLAFMGLFGVATPLLNTPSTVILQEHVEDAYLGRAFSVLTMISSSVMPLAMLIFGPMADLVRLELILAVCGALTLALSFIVPRTKRLMETGEPVGQALGNPADSNETA